MLFYTSFSLQYTFFYKYSVGKLKQVIVKFLQIKLNILIKKSLFLTSDVLDPKFQVRPEPDPDSFFN